MGIEYLAPAKINLFLDVKKKRKDGYHDIETIFLKLKLFDSIYVENRKNDIKIICGHPQLKKSQKNNLVYKAALLLKEISRTKRGATIHLKKKIPIGAGLGGGSSGAAAVILALNRLWKLRLSKKQLWDIGRRIGADVPVFLIPDNAVLARGIGDKLKPIKLGKKLWVLLVIPQISVSTKDIYEALPRNLTKAGFDVKLLSHALRNLDLQTMEKMLFNRLETVTFKKHKLLKVIKQKISALGVRAVLMSGSGSAIFGLAESKIKAMHVKKKLRGVYNVMVVRSL